MEGLSLRRRCHRLPAGRRQQCGHARLQMRLRHLPGSQREESRYCGDGIRQHTLPPSVPTQECRSLSHTRARTHTHTRAGNTVFLLRPSARNPSRQEYPFDNADVPLSPLYTSKRDPIFCSFSPSRVGVTKEASWKKQHSRGPAGSPPRNQNGVGKFLKRSHLGQQDRPLGRTSVRPDARQTHFPGPCVG